MVKKHILELKHFVRICPEVRTWLHEGGGLLTNLADSDPVEYPELADYLLTILVDDNFDFRVYKLCNGKVTAIHAWDVDGSWDLVVLYDHIEDKVVAWEYL